MGIKNIPDYNGAGIYMIKGINNDLFYIGSSTHVSKRLLSHDSAIRNRGGSTKKMQSLIQPEYQFEAVILEKISDQRPLYYLHDRENYYIQKFNAYGKNGLNAAPLYGYQRNDLVSILRKELMYLMQDVDELEKRIADKIHGEEYKEKLIVSTEERIRFRLETIYKNMQQLKDKKG